MKIEATKLPNLLTNGFVKTSGGDGTLSVDTGTYGFQVATGTVDGSNTIFTFTSAPNAVCVDGVVRQKVQSDGTISWTGTTVITLDIPPNFDIFGIA